MPLKAPEHEVLLKHGSTSGYEIDAWCTEKFGPRWSAVDNRTGVWCCFWAGRKHPGYYRWLFTKEEDLALFVLRWT